MKDEPNVDNLGYVIDRNIPVFGDYPNVDKNGYVIDWTKPVDYVPEENSKDSGYQGAYSHSMGGSSSGTGLSKAIEIIMAPFSLFLGPLIVLMIIDAIFDLILPIFKFLFIPSLGVVVLATIILLPLPYKKLGVEFNIRKKSNISIYNLIIILNYPASFIISYVCINEHIVQIVDKIILAMPPMTIGNAILQVPIIIALYMLRFAIHICMIPLIQKLLQKVTIVCIKKSNK